MNTIQNRAFFFAVQGALATIENDSPTWCEYMNFERGSMETVHTMLTEAIGPSKKEQNHAL